MMHDNPKVSIIIPVYNLAGFVEQAIQSILDQTYSHWELLVIDDGSTDQSAEKIQKFLSLDSRIRYFFQDNSGVSNARNFGLSKATGEFILFLDADDLLVKRAIGEMILRFMSDTEIDMVFTQYVEMQSKKIVKECKALQSDYHDFFTFYGTHGPNEVAHMAIMYKRALLYSSNIKFTPNMKSGEDAEFVIKASLCAQEISYIAQPLYIVTRREDSASRGGLSLDSVMDDIAGLERTIIRLESLVPTESLKVLLVGTKKRLLSRENLIKRFHFNQILNGNFDVVHEFLQDNKRVFKPYYHGFKGVLEKIKLKIIFSENKFVWTVLCIMYSPIKALKNLNQK